MNPLDADAVAVLEVMAHLELPPIGSLPADEMRALRRMRAPAPQPGPEMRSVEDVEIPATGRMIAARLYRPLAGVAPLLVFFHGGGWTFGGLAASDRPVRLLAEATGCCVLSVDYRLAPEHPFPAAFEDAYDACVWASDRAGALSGRAGPIIVAGESAGANLSAGVAGAFKSEGLPLAAQILSCPLVSARFELAFAADFTPPFLSLADVAWFLDQYVPDAASRTDPRFAPAMAASLAGLPATLVATAEHDLLRAQGEGFADRLREDGVRVVTHRYTGTFHGFLELASETRAAARLRTDIRNFIADLAPTTGASEANVTGMPI